MNTTIAPMPMRNMTTTESMVNRYMMLCNTKCSTCFRKNVAKMSCNLTSNKEFGKCWVRGVLDNIEATIGKGPISERIEQEVNSAIAAVA
jgi:hypothetical protein